MCGEKAPFLAGAHIYHGSPPRVRGKVCNQQVTKFKLGITPACAGKRLDALLVFFRCQDHPRVCGEKKMWILIKGGTLGSPPRVRGKEGEGKCRKNLSRITPACAGKSTLCPLSPWLHEGSPPRVRGKVSNQQVTKFKLGITPACAGKR